LAKAKEKLDVISYNISKNATREFPFHFTPVPLDVIIGFLLDESYKV
jgi:hypothetical protein